MNDAYASTSVEYDSVFVLRGKKSRNVTRESRQESRRVLLPEEVAALQAHFKAMNDSVPSPDISGGKNRSSESQTEQNKKIRTLARTVGNT